MMDDNELDGHGSLCSSPDCSQQQDPEQTGGLFLFLAYNIFGPFGDRLTEGYCVFCKKRNLSRAFLSLVVLISLVVALIELPWKGPLFAALMIVVWTAILGKWAFGTPK